MRLVKINDIILNMDRIAVIKGKDADGHRVNVYAYAEGQEIWLGICENRETYQELIDGIYQNFGESFIGEIVYTKDDEELWT